MKKFRVVLLAVLSLVFCVCIAGACNKKPEDNPPPAPSAEKTIATAQELRDAAAKIAANTDGYATAKFVLGADIVIEGDWTPIKGFKGELDGKFHKISGFDLVEGGLLGLFETVENATIRNLTVEGSLANSAPTVTMGMLAARAVNSRVQFVTASGTIAAAGTRAAAGGLIGSAESGTVLSDVVSTVTLTGSAQFAGGIAAELKGGSVVMNAYNAGKLTSTARADANNTAYLGGIAAVKEADSAVWRSLSAGEIDAAAADVGPVVGFSPAKAYQESYVVQSFSLGQTVTGKSVNALLSGTLTAADYSKLNWNAADWDLSGVPALKKAESKTYAPITVTVDGQAVSVARGEKLPASVLPGADRDNVAFTGLAYTADGVVFPFYAKLPVDQSLALTTQRVDYSDMAGKWLKKSEAVPSFELLSVGAETVGFADATDLSEEGSELTRTAIRTEEMTLSGDRTYIEAVAYYTDGDDIEYRVYLRHTLSGAEETGLLTVERRTTAGEWSTAATYMPDPSALAGVYENGNVYLVLTSDIVKTGTLGYAIYNDDIEMLAESYLFYREGSPVPAMKASFSGTAKVILPGTDSGVLLDGEACGYAQAYFNGDWVGKSGGVNVNAETKKITLPDGTSADYTVKNTAYGNAVVYTADGVEYAFFATFSGSKLVNLADGTEQALYPKIAGNWYAFDGGTRTLIEVNGNDLTFNGTEVTAVPGEDAEHAFTLSFAVSGRQYLLTVAGENRAVLTLPDESEQVFYSEKALRVLFDNVWTMGSKNFTFGRDGLVTYRTAAGDQVSYDDLTLTEAEEQMTLVCNGSVYSFTVANAVLTWKGNGTSYSLYPSVELEKFYGDWAYASDDAEDSPLLFLFSEGGLQYNGLPYSEYTLHFEENSWTLTGKFDGSETTLTYAGGYLTFYQDYGTQALMPEEYAAFVGKYADGSEPVTVEGTAVNPNTFEFTKAFKVVYGGKTYTAEQFRIAYDEGTDTLTVTFRPEGASADVVASVKGKIATIDGKAFMLTNKLLPNTSDYAWSDSNRYMNLAGTKQFRYYYSSNKMKFGFKEGSGQEVTSTAAVVTTLEDGSTQVVVTMETGNRTIVFRDHQIVTVDGETYVMFGDKAVFVKDNHIFERTGKGGFKFDGTALADYTPSVNEKGQLCIAFTADTVSYHVVLENQLSIKVNNDVYINGDYDHLVGRIYTFGGDTIELRADGNYYINDEVLIWNMLTVREMRGVAGGRYWNLYAGTEGYDNYIQAMVDGDSNYYYIDYFAACRGYYISDDNVVIYADSSYLYVDGNYNALDKFTITKEGNVITAEKTGEFVVTFTLTDGKVTSVSYDNKELRPFEFDRRSYFGPVIANDGTAFEIDLNRLRFGDFTFVFVNGRMAIQVKYNFTDYCLFKTNDPDMPVMAVSKNYAAYMGTAKTGDLEFTVDYVKGKNSMDQFLPEIQVTANKGTIKTVEAKSVQIKIVLTRDGADTAYIVTKSYDGKVFVTTEAQRKFIGSGNLDGKTLRVDLALDANGKTILDITYDGTAIDDNYTFNADYTRLDFSVGGAAYVAVYEGERFYAMSKVRFDFLGEVTVDGKPMTVARTIDSDKTVYTLTYDGEKINNVTLMEDGESLLFSTKGRVVILSMKDLTLVTIQADPNELAWVGTHRVDFKDLIVSMTVVNGKAEYVVQYGSDTATEFTFLDNGGTLNFKYNTTEYYFVWNQGNIKLYEKAQWDFIGVYDNITINLDPTTGSGFEVVYDGKSYGYISFSYDNSYLQFTASPNIVFGYLKVVDGVKTIVISQSSSGLDYYVGYDYTGTGSGKSISLSYVLDRETGIVSVGGTYGGKKITEVVSYESATDKIVLKVEGSDTPITDTLYDEDDY